MGNDRPWCTVIGVVSDVRQASLTEPPRPFFYLPEFQFAWTRLYLVAHLSGDPKTVVPAIQAAVSALDSTVPVHEVVSLEALRTDSQYVPRAITLLVVIFAVLALMLAAVGVYGLLAYSVARRSHEFGVRIALGAGPGDVIRLVVRQGLTLALAGELAGLPLALLLYRTARRPALRNFADRSADLHRRRSLPAAGRARRLPDSCLARHQGRALQRTPRGVIPRSTATMDTSTPVRRPEPTYFSEQHLVRRGAPGDA